MRLSPHILPHCDDVEDWSVGGEQHVESTFDFVLVQFLWEVFDVEPGVELAAYIKSHFSKMYV